LVTGQHGSGTALIRLERVEEALADHGEIRRCQAAVEICSWLDHDTSLRIVNRLPHHPIDDPGAPEHRGVVTQDGYGI
jgi:hypothetical protein